VVYDSEIADSNPFRGMDVRIFALLMLSCGIRSKCCNEPNPARHKKIPLLDVI
jgi:hypothetical protein